MQAGLSADIHHTATELRGVNADLAKVKVKITSMQGRIETVQGQYDELVVQLADLDGQLVQVEAQEAAGKADLGARREHLAERIRSAYDSDRTSLLESFLSGGTFTDVLAEMSYYIDVGEQDKALASQIAHDQETLAAIHQTVADTRDRTNELRQDTAAQKRALDQSLADLKDAKASLKTLEQKTATALAHQKTAYATLARNKAAAAAALAKSAAAQKRLQDKIAELLRRRSFLSRIPSRYNGALSWPMGGSVTQNFGCTGFTWEPRLGNCRHFHRGIDVVAPIGTPVRASGERHRRLHRLELCRRLRSGLDRGHRPQPVAADVVRAHVAVAPERDPFRQSRARGPDHRLRGQHRPLDRRAPPLGGHVQREFRQPAPLPVGPVAANRPLISGQTVRASIGP